MAVPLAMSTNTSRTTMAAAVFARYSSSGRPAHVAMRFGIAVNFS